MATITVISNPHNPLAPSWDEAIVPTLRKRLESESRILTQRLSTVSSSSTDDAQQPQQQQQQHQSSHPQSQPQEDPQDTRHSTSSSRRTPNGTRSHTPTNSAYPSQRPSAIPRPSYSRTGDRSNVRSNTSGPVDSTSSSNGSRPTTGRKRTQSTPFPFEPPDLTNMTSSAATGKQLSSSTANSTPKPNGGRTTPTPSRIPTVTSRIRSGSQSSQGIGTVGKSAGAKVFPSESNSTHTIESLSASVQAQSSSSSVSRQRVSEDHQAGRGNVQQRGGIDEGTINERLSSDEERPFQHWYRGDVARNGGVGEYRVGKREEMLDIASFGHKSLSRSHRTQDSTVLPSIFKEQPLRKRAESVSSVERTSLYRETPDEITIGRVLDETPLTDAETNSIGRRPRRQSIASMERISLYMEPPGLGEVLGEDPSSGIAAGMGHDAQKQTTMKLPPPEGARRDNVSVPNASSGQNRLPHPRPRNVSNPRHESKGSTSTTASVSDTVNSRNGRHPRGRTQSPVERSKTPQKKPDQKRSKSVTESLRHPEPPNSTDFSLVNAVPDTRTPIPIDGNWDEMVLPTVARRMGIEYEKREPTVQKSSEPQIVPAPGTFGFDYSKYRPPRSSEEAIPMSEFGLREPLPPLTDQEELPVQQPTPIQQTPEGTVEKPPEPIEQMRSRRGTLPPFAHYIEAHSPRERQDVPQVIIGQHEAETTQQATVHVEEGEDTGCCKCLIM